MDCMLRGHRVVHREYFVVGKGRDMGFLSILGFFCKLSSGTAQMSTSRQAYRLGVRLGIGRLFGFFYAHIGYYYGQLLFFHATYLIFAFSFLAALADGSGLLTGVEQTMLLRTLFGPLYVLSLAASLLPLQLALLTERGVCAALWEPIRQILAGSPLFFAIQSRCIGHYLSGEFASGGAAYIPTGRSLAIERQPFSALYAAFATTCLYPGVDLALFLVLGSLASPRDVALPMATWLAAGIIPLALLFGIALFNPRCFELRLSVRDFKAWVQWLHGDGWAKYHKDVLAKKRGSAAYAFVLPSKELLLSFPLLVLAYEAIHPHLWSWARLPVLTIIALPLLPVALLGVVQGLQCIANALVRLVRPRRQPEGKAEGTAVRPPSTLSSLSPPCAGLVCAAVVAAEVSMLAFAAPALSRTGWMSVASARYFSWRAVCNSLAYLPAQRTLGPQGQVGPTGQLVGLAWLCDAILGSCLQLPIFLVASLPCSALLHLSCLFYTTRQQLETSHALHGHDQVGVDEYKTEMEESRKCRQGRHGSDTPTSAPTGTAAKLMSSLSVKMLTPVQEAPIKGTRRDGAGGRRQLKKCTTMLQRQRSMLNGRLQAAGGQEELARFLGDAPRAARAVSIAEESLGEAEKSMMWVCSAFPS